MDSTKPNPQEMSKANPQPLNWVQTGGLKQEFELQDGQQVIANLKLTGMNSTASYTWANGDFSFSFSGFFNRKLHIVDNKSGQEVAHFEPNWNSEGIVSFGNQQQLGWVHTSFWHSNWSFEDQHGSQLIRFIAKNGFFKQGTTVEIDPSIAQLPELMLLIGLGWILVVYTNNAAAATTVVIATTA